jgi:hypothetical protein
MIIIDQKKEAEGGGGDGIGTDNNTNTPDNNGGKEVLNPWDPLPAMSTQVVEVYSSITTVYIFVNNFYTGGVNTPLSRMEPGSPGGGGGFSRTDKAGYGLNAFGFANGAKTEIIDYAVRTGSNKYGLKAELQVLGKAGTRYLSAAKGLSKLAGFAGLALTGIDAYNKGQWQNHHTADVIIGIGSLYLLTGPVGWAVGGAYFLLDVGIKSYTGKSITENLFD